MIVTHSISMAKTKDFPLPVLDLDDNETKLAFAPIGSKVLDLQHELSLCGLRHAVTQQDLLLAEGQKQSTKDPLPLSALVCLNYKLFSSRSGSFLRWCFSFLGPSAKLQLLWTKLLFRHRQKLRKLQPMSNPAQHTAHHTA